MYKENINIALSNLFGKRMTCAAYEAQVLDGGTLGDVRLISGQAADEKGRKETFKLVYKAQKKWMRLGDPPSWRREYDLYAQGFERLFADELRWPKCYHAQLEGEETRIWMEYLEGVSGGELSLETLERAALELGRFQSRIAREPRLAQNTACLSDRGFPRREFTQWHTQMFSYEFLISDKCRLPGRIKHMLRDGKITLYEGKSFEYACLRSGENDMPVHLTAMLKDIDRRAEGIFEEFDRLPTVLCHRDFWIANIILSGGKIRLIDWDGAGWGFAGEDIASLISDDVPAEKIGEYRRRLIPRYYEGLSEYMDADIPKTPLLRDMILTKFGYRYFQDYFYEQSEEERRGAIAMLQAIYDL